MRRIFSLLGNTVRGIFRMKRALIAENLSLRQQLANYQHLNKRPRINNIDRLFWILLARFWNDWKSTLCIVKPATVIRWHRLGFKLFWRFKSKAKSGRPCIPMKHIKFIQRISCDQPAWGEDRIADELRIKFGVQHSPSTVRRYMVRSINPDDSQHWRTFIKNHGARTFACDFIVQHTAFFQVAYVFVVMELESRKIVHINVTTNPSLDWVKNQFREITSFGTTPRFVLHDNDGIFGQFGKPKSGLRCALDKWLSETMGITGIPTPFHAPNANARLERFNGSLRREALNHFIFMSTDHIHQVVKEYVEFYNHARPSQATGAIPDPYPELTEPPPPDGNLIALPVLGGLQHDYRLAA